MATCLVKELDFETKNQIVSYGNCGLWVLNEILKKSYPENLIKIVGAVWELPAK